MQVISPLMPWRQDPLLVTLGGWNDRRSYNIDLTCGLSQKSIDALNSYGLFLVDKDIPITIVLLITIL